MTFSSHSSRPLILAASPCSWTYASMSARVASPLRILLFTSDKNLARWVADQVPEKEVVAYDGVCPTHDGCATPPSTAPARSSPRR